MERIWEVISSLVTDFNSLFTSGEGVSRIRDRLADPVCYVLFALLVVVGVILSLHGYKLAKFAIITASVGAGFTFGLGVVNPFILAHIEMTPEEAVWLVWVAPVALAIIFAVLMIRFVRFAFFAIGGLGGFYVGHWISALVGADTVVTMIFVSLGILLFGLLVMAIRKLVLKIGIAILGALMAAFGTGGIFVTAGLPQAYVPALTIVFFATVTLAVVYACLRKSGRSSRFQSFDEE
ncbi:MAG: DUF4203 domain-containing protein [Clostridia bacterium]|nr:DUF4203 domain-containing protein [Clostridia bacterium]